MTSTWFAWRPVKLRNGKWVWLKKVSRRFTWVKRWVQPPEMKGWYASVKKYEYEPLGSYWI